jgi:hypothetical protein
METSFITIQEAADLSQKSIQTIRRAIKAKKLKVRKMKTPQGFNYLVDKNSLCGFYGIQNVEKNSKSSEKNETTMDFGSEISRSKSAGKDMISADEFRNFTKILEKMVNQHSDERQNFMRLVNTLQEKIFVLENQMNLLKTPAKKWYQVWK